MKPLMLICVIVLAGCGKSDQVRRLEEENRKLTAEVESLKKGKENNSTKVKPATPLTPEEQKTLRENVVGEYERLKKTPTGFIIDKYIFLENGIVELYYNGEKEEEEVKWKISKEGEIHNEFKDGFTTVYRMNPDGSLTFIAGTGKDGEREDIPKGYQSTAKKIK